MTYLCVRAVVCVQAVSLWLRLYLARLLCGGGGTGSAAGCDGSPLAAWSPCGTQNRGHHLCTASTHMNGPCDILFTHTLSRHLSYITCTRSYSSAYVQYMCF